MTDDDLSIEEKRVFSSKAGKTEVFVAAGVGCVVVDVSGDRVGGFRVDHHCTARDVAGRGGRIVVATDEDVLLAPGYEALGFGPAMAVGLTEDEVVAVGEDGSIGRLAFDAGNGWRTVGGVDGPRAVDGRLVAAEEGVFRVTDRDLRHAGLDDVRDVAAAGPFAATGSGLFYLGNGWMEIEDGEWDVVDAAPDGRAHAVGAAGIRRRTETDGGTWRAVDRADDLADDEAFVEFAYGEDVVCAVTDEGTFLVDAGDGLRTQTLGLRDVGGVAIP
ncbi:hypothetical protein C2R22_19205 [Salinigranum rubrum]|uniref:HVO-0234-like beta-propeller domain-containing protein n=1 Tax=Salinigranum rubrum TaxID=755307 RepID=A0A2I8VNJ7_9EURY|nr:hypothetical protein [Salinigranum rubrum]AUV83507.1 hypothetical protein C2R22_19205 [Salinigranum rubrum]